MAILTQKQLAYESLKKSRELNNDNDKAKMIRNILLFPDYEDENDLLVSIKYYEHEYVKIWDIIKLSKLSNKDLRQKLYDLEFSIKNQAEKDKIEFEKQKIIDDEHQRIWTPIVNQAKISFFVDKKVKEFKSYDDYIMSLYNLGWPILRRMSDELIKQEKMRKNLIIRLENKLKEIEKEIEEKNGYN